MAKLIQFPKEEYNRYLEALQLYKQKDFLSARIAFQTLQHLPYFRTLMTKPYVLTLIALKDFRSVYQWIEDALLLETQNEDELIEYYIYTMIQEKKYREAMELIYLFLDAMDLSMELRKTLLKLKNMAREFEKRDQIEQRLKEIKFSYHHELVDLILDLENLSIKEHESLILETLQDPYADPFIKYQLLGLLYKHDYRKKVNYVNSLNESFEINTCEFQPIDELESFQVPPRLANQLLQRESLVVDLKFIENIWLNEYLLIYPKSLKDYELIAFHLCDKVLYLMGEKQQLGHFRIE